MFIYLLYAASPIIIYMIMLLVCRGNISENLALKKGYLIVCGSIMVLMIGLRHQYLGSSDTSFYYNTWERLSGLPSSEIWNYIMSVDLEPGYLLTTWLLSKLSSWGQWALITSGIVYAWSVCAFVYKNARFAPMALVVFNCLGLFTFMVQGLRQAIAMSICLWALEQCKQKNLLKFILLVSLACSFHASAIVFCVVYVIARLKINVKSVAIFSFLAAVGMALMSYIFALLNYMMNEDYAMGSGTETGGTVAIMISGVIVLFGLLSQDKKSPHYAMFIYMTIIAAFAMVMRNMSLTIAERIGHYFSFGQMVVLSNSIYVMRSRDMRLLAYSAAMLLCLGVAKHKTSYSALMPYQFYWEYRSAPKLKR